MQMSSDPLRRHWQLKMGLSIAVVMLVIAVAGLSTAAKNGQYFSPKSPIRSISISTKMNVTRTPVVFTGEPVQPVARIVHLQPPIQASRLEEAVISPVPRVTVTASTRHRAPPIPIA